MTYGYIIAAGKQSRFASATPKAMMPYKGRPLIEWTIERMRKYCDNIFVVCSTENWREFIGYNLITIKSGQGCGDAVYKALQRKKINADDTCFIQWGDALVDENLYSILMTSYRGRWLIPCCKEVDPYVQIDQVDAEHVRAHFSKYGEVTDKSGWHDQSVFYGSCGTMYNALNCARDQFYFSKEDRYVHKHNNELQFLDVFNDTPLKAEIVELSKNMTFAFNTLEEFNKLVD